MNNKYFAYALAVTIVSTILSWGSMVRASTSSGGSSWSSHSGGGYGGGHSGGGHK